MKIGLILKVLWRRHRWESLFYLVCSCLLSGLLWKEIGETYYQGLAALEVASLVWLVTRVAFTQPGFGTFGGWRTRPSQRTRYWGCEVLFLAFLLGTATALRMMTAAELLQPVAEDWRVLWNELGVGFFRVMILFGVCKIVGIGLEENDSRTVRPRCAWGIVLTFVVGVLVAFNFKGWRPVGGGTMDGRQIDPRGLLGVQNWQWLRRGFDRAGQVPSMKIVKLPLENGAAWSEKGVRIELVEFRRVGDMVEARVEVRTNEASHDELPPDGWLMLVFPNGYFGAVAHGSRRNEATKVPLISFDERTYTARFYTPLLIPENELSPEELLKGTELWIGLEDAKLLPERRQPYEPEIGPSREEKTRMLLISYSSDDLKEAKMYLGGKGRSAMDEVLAASPWSKGSVHDIVVPYLIEHAGEDEKVRLLKMLRRDPVIGDVFLEKGWADLAEPILREHLNKGKSLTRRSLIYLAKLDEKEMGPRLENQLLRLTGDFDEAAEAVRKHSGVNWNQVRRTAWERMAAGFGSHHVWARWGAELGEKEALRVILVKANSGNKWERGLLEYWFGKRATLIAELRKRWDEVEFVEGKWRFRPL